MQNHRTPFNAIDSYLNQNRVNYVEMISRPAPQQPHENNGNSDNHDVHTRRSNVFTPPGANWISRKKSVASSPGPDRVLPQPQSMNHFPYQATVTMLPTPPPMNNNNSIRLPTSTSMSTTNNGMATAHPLHHRYSHEGRKQGADQFPPLSAHWSSSSSFHVRFVGEKEKEKKKETFSLYNILNTRLSNKQYLYYFL
ncbi:hypothetical protein BDC45DRAFT_310765 [Circinella umbellata]|nr:hypothetical protein BDC45DRAFT_310765 [Circinella umbellata]